MARQKALVELIASENYVSRAVMKAQGTQMPNTYAEDCPGKRYHGGCQNIDVVGQLSIDRACGLFGVDYANVQPHSGAQANAATFIALDKPSDTVLGMSLAHNSNLTHGAALNFPGKHYHAVQYGLNPEPARTTTRRSSA